MRTSHVRWFVIFGVLCVTLSISVFNIGCSKPPEVEGNTNEVTDGDGGTQTDTTTNNNNNTPPDTNNNSTPDSNTNNPDSNTNNTNNNTNNNNTTGPKKCSKNEDCDTKNSEICENGTCTNNCAPGCQNCSQADPDNLALGASCERKADKPNPCNKSLGLDCAPFSATNDIPQGTCLNSCKTDDECTKIRIGLKCLDFTVGTVTIKACGLRNKAGDPCNANEQVYCATGNVCLISGSDGAGTCIKECASTAECDKDQVCRQAIASNTRTFCLAPVLAGPKCIGDTCDFTRRTENCLNGLSCFQGVCIKPCDKANGDKDCDTAKGETCFKRLFSTDPAYCRGKETVDKVGDACNTTTLLCDSSKGLQCVSEICAKTCDGSKGEANNPDCSALAGALCKQVQITGGNINICQTAAKANERCGVNAFCPEKTRCIPLTGRPFPICFIDCDPCNSTRKAGTQTWTHPNCDGGKTGCSALTYSDGRSAGGVCIPSGNPVLDVNEQCTDPEKSCKEGLLCVRFGSSDAATVCSNYCDLTKGEDSNPDCKDNGRCGRLSNGDGICIPTGKPEIPEGEFCGDNLQKGCLKDLICVNFSSAEDAKGICSKKCKPTNQGGDGSECPSGECLGLTSGDGVCSPQRKRTQKLGERCRGDRGTPHYNECLETEGGKKVQCAPPGDSSDARVCMVFCDPANGTIDNKGCKDAGLTNHICLPDKDRPELGACVEQCTFTNRLRCETSKCQYGACQEKQLDSQQGQCTDTAAEANCKSRGGTCVNKTCIANACL